LLSFPQPSAAIDVNATNAVSANVPLILYSTHPNPRLTPQSQFSYRAACFTAAQLHGLGWPQMKMESLICRSVFRVWALYAQMPRVFRRVR
jgi:hypothetical protein